MCKYMAYKYISSFSSYYDIDRRLKLANCAQWIMFSIALLVVKFYNVVY